MLVEELAVEQRQRFLVQAGGAAATLDRLLGGDIPEPALRAAVISRSAGVDPRRLAEAALHRADRLGARVVVPSDPEWPTGVDTLSVLELDGGDPVEGGGVRRPVAVVGVRDSGAPDSPFIADT